MDFSHHNHFLDRDQSLVENAEIYSGKNSNSSYIGPSPVL